MAATKVGIVYGASSGILRRWIVPDDDSELESAHPLAPGEAMLIVDRSAARSREDIDVALAAKIGRPPPSARCVVVNAAGEVVGAIMADPAIDSVPDHTLILSDLADVGWRVIAGVLTAPSQD